VTTLRIDVPARPDGDEVVVSPSRDEVRAHVGTYRQVPVAHTYLDDCETPVSAMLKLRDGGPCFLLESAEQGQRLGRYSMIGIDPQAVIRAEGLEPWGHRPEEEGTDDGRGVIYLHPRGGGRGFLWQMYAGDSWYTAQPFEDERSDTLGIIAVNHLAHATRD